MIIKWPRRLMPGPLRLADWTGRGRHSWPDFAVFFDSAVGQAIHDGFPEMPLIHR